MANFILILPENYTGKSLKKWLRKEKLSFPKSKSTSHPLDQERKILHERLHLATRKLKKINH